MTKNLPWRSIGESVVAFEPARLSLAEARQSPCHSCPTSPCCTHLPLHTFQVTNLAELDHAVYVSNFDRIELGLSATGEWSIYYTFPCRHLDREDFSCTVHGQSRQPQICVNYSPYQCWYKRVFTQSVSDEFIRIDRQRLDFILSHVVFDENRRITEAPDWETMLDGIARLPAQPNSNGALPPEHDPALDQWFDLARGAIALDPDGQALVTLEALRDPCLNCQAYCCTTLVFPTEMPATAANLDYLRFCLGFPGIELGIADGAWSIVVKTTCRHLDGNRCAVYGQPERPLICRYYDPWKCSYRTQFGLPRPSGFVRIRLEQFDWLTECFRFDQEGTIVEFPAVDTIRDHVEAHWRAERP